MSSGSLHPGLLHEILDHLGTDDLMKMIKNGEDVCCVSREVTEILENRFETKLMIWPHDKTKHPPAYETWATQRGIIVYSKHLTGFTSNLRQLFLHELHNFRIPTLKLLSGICLDLCCLTDFSDITDLEGLENVVNVTLSGCISLVSVGHIKKARRLVVNECPVITGYDSLTGLAELQIEFCDDNDLVYVLSVLDEIYNMNLSVLGLYAPAYCSTITLDLSRLNVSERLYLMDFNVTRSARIRELHLNYVGFQGDVEIICEEVYIRITGLQHFSSMKIDATNLTWKVAAGVGGEINGEKIKIRAGNIVVEYDFDLFMIFVEIERVYGVLKFVGCVGTYTHDKRVVAHVDATESRGLDVVVAGGVVERVQDVIDVWTIRRIIPALWTHVGMGMFIGVICGEFLYIRGYHGSVSFASAISGYVHWLMYKRKTIEYSLNQIDEVRSQMHKPITNTQAIVTSSILGITFGVSALISIKLIGAGMRFLLRR